MLRLIGMVCLHTFSLLNCIQKQWVIINVVVDAGARKELDSKDNLIHKSESSLTVERRFYIFFDARTTSVSRCVGDLHPHCILMTSHPFFGHTQQ